MKNPFTSLAGKARRLGQKLHAPETRSRLLAWAGDGFLLGALGVIIAVAGAPLTAPVLATAGGLFALGLGSKIASRHFDVSGETARPEPLPGHDAGEKPSGFAGRTAKSDFAAANDPGAAPIPVEPGPAVKAEQPKP
jgi:hypothetical protein